jgi:polygalacturonase
MSPHFIPFYLALFSWLALTAAELVFNPLSFGAIGNGIADDTHAVRAAAAALDAAGGGVLLMPFGYSFWTGPFNLSSNAILLIAGTVIASNSSADYFLVPPLPWFGGGVDAPMSGQPEWSPFISAWHAHNISITGGGTIDGNGAAWWACSDAQLVGPPCNGYSRPQLIRPTHVSGFSLSQVSLRDSPSWTVHLANVTGAELLNFSVYAPANRGNTDGVDVDCSRNVSILNFFYAGGDDAVAIKSGLDWLGQTYGAPSEDIRVSGLRIESGNGFAIGSEMSAGVRRVVFDGVILNCAPNCKHGSYIKSCRGRGGFVEDVTFKNISVSHVGFAHGVTLEYVRNLPPANASATPRISNITYADGDVTFGGASVAYQFQGLPDSVLTGLRLSNMSVASNVPVCNACSNATGVCDDGTSATVCPPCLRSIQDTPSIMIA